MNEENVLIDENFIMSPMVDFVFKALFGTQKNVEFLKSLVSAILDIDVKEINSIEFLPNELLKTNFIGKSAVTDIRFKMNCKDNVNIEIQLSSTGDMARRTLFYWGKMYVGQLKRGRKYTELDRCITINILDFDYTKSGKLHSVYRLYDEDKRLLTDVLEIHFIELPNLDKRTDNTKLINWLKFIKVKDKEEAKMLAKTDNVLEAAYEELEQLSGKPECYEQYVLTEMAITDYITRIDEAMRQKTVFIVKNMKENGLPMDMIIKCTGLPKEEVEKIN